MAHLAWKSRFSVHHPVIDAQHHGLLDLINDLGHLQGGSDPDAMTEIFHQLCSYALNHFATEERLLEEVHYPGLEAHAQEHARFVQQLLELNQAYDPGDTRLPAVTFIFVRDWYQHHILDVDQAYAPYLSTGRPQP